ncbi:MAG: hypothetical protein WAJ85_11745 [Candidatus Baltobacteraceae bacterium]|jgi:hypothetical protein
MRTSPAIPQRRALVALASASLCLTPLAGAARTCAPHEIQAPLGCVDTAVTKALAPTGPSMADGGELAFRDDIAPGHGAAGQKIRTLYVPPNYDLVANSGDHVRVCLLQVPWKTASCNPSTDIRGREFLVFNRSKPQGENADVLFDGEHGCGGA